MGWGLDDLVGDALTGGLYSVGKGAVGAIAGGGKGGGNVGGGFAGPDVHGVSPEDQAKMMGNGAYVGSDGQVKDGSTNAPWSWGGKPGGAAADAGRYQGLAAGYGGMQAPPIDYGQSNGYMSLGNEARNSQVDALGLMHQAALGNAPSQAALQMRQGNDQAMASQLAMAAGARGQAALGSAQYNAAGNIANLQTQNNNAMGMQRAQEMAQARGAFGQMSTGMRGQDEQFAGLAAQNAQAQGQLGLGYRQLGLQGQLGFEQMGMGVNQAQLNASMGQQGYNQNQWVHQSNMDEASARAGEANGWKAVGTVSGALTG